MTGPFTGKTCVVTGTIEGYSRDAIKAILLGQGARVTDAVSGKTDIVIHGSDAGSKLEKARGLGVRLVDGAEFRRLAGGGSGAPGEAAGAARADRNGGG